MKNVNTEQAEHFQGQNLVIRSSRDTVVSLRNFVGA
jgi:hypothetical protein